MGVGCSKALASNITLDFVDVQAILTFPCPGKGGAVTRACVGAGSEVGCVKPGIHDLALLRSILTGDWAVGKRCEKKHTQA